MPLLQTPDLEDVKESVRQGVTKVAGKLGTLANGVMSSLQVSPRVASPSRWESSEGRTEHS